MLEYDKIDISEGIDVNKTNASKYMIFVIIGILKILVLWYYEPSLYNGCHDLMPKAISFNDIAILYVKGSAYSHFWYMSKDDAISIMNNSNLIDRKGAL